MSPALDLYKAVSVVYRMLACNELHLLEQKRDKVCYLTEADTVRGAKKARQLEASRDEI
jgi:hypothetical protein